jgi:hypothetical protein
MSSTGHPIFDKGYTVRSDGTSGEYTAYFKVEENGKEVNLPEQTLRIIVGYENITIDISGMSVNGNNGNKTSTYDKTQSSIRLAGNQGDKNTDTNLKNGLKLTVLAKSGNNTDNNIIITDVQIKNATANENLRPIKSGNEVTLYYFEKQSSSAGPSGALNKVNYVGVLEMTYKYNNYNGSKEETKNFLLYHDEYYQ